MPGTGIPGFNEHAKRIATQFDLYEDALFSTKVTGLEWDDDAALLDAWREGRTGYPVVDAAMRQLRATGWMHNRARMIVGSFLTKDLQQDWREGERWFWDTLVDADLAADVAEGVAEGVQPLAVHHVDGHHRHVAPQRQVGGTAPERLTPRCATAGSIGGRLTPVNPAPDGSNVLPDTPPVLPREAVQRWRLVLARDRLQHLLQVEGRVDDLDRLRQQREVTGGILHRPLSRGR